VWVRVWELWAEGFNRNSLCGVIVGLIVALVLEQAFVESEFLIASLLMPCKKKFKSKEMRLFFWQVSVLGCRRPSGSLSR
jgi:hypothetical protein